VIDNHSYSETISTIIEISPDEILLHDGAHGKTLSLLIEQNCSNDARILYISRQYFDQDRGADMLKKVSSDSVDSDLVAKYIVLSGAYCLLRYVENCNGMTFAAKCLRIEYGSIITGRMNIDRRTAGNLELITNMRWGNQKETLFGVINLTSTVAGARCLRENILRPHTDISTIQMRHDIVDALLRNNRISTEIVGVLKKLPDLDKMLSGLTNISKKVTPKSARVSIDTLIYLKEIIKLAPELATLWKCLDIPNCLLLQAIIANLTNIQLLQHDSIISQMISTSTLYSKSAHEMRNQECFMLKSGIHGLLDLSRKTFLQTVEDIYKVSYEQIMQQLLLFSAHNNTQLLST
jgi:DNA mismatch repair protein MSH4